MIRATNVHLPRPPTHYDERDQSEVRRAMEEAVVEISAAAQQTERTVEEVESTVGIDYLREEVSEDTASALATLTLIPIDGAPSFDSIHTSTQAGNGSWSAWAPVAADGSGNYVDTVSLVEKHVSKIAYQVYRDSVIVQQRVVTFDYGTVADVTNVAVAYSGGVATVTVKFDSDTKTGTAAAEYSTNAGSSWSAFDVAVDRTGSFDVAQITTGKQTALVRGYNSASAAGTEVPVEINRLDVPKRFNHVSCQVHDDGTDDTYTLTWTVSESVEDASDSIEITLYRGTTEVHKISSITPSDGSDSYIAVGAGDGIADEHWAEFNLYDPTGSLDYRRTRIGLSTT